MANTARKYNIQAVKCRAGGCNVWITFTSSMVKEMVHVLVYEAYGMELLQESETLP